jgi:F-type H+-transporting ATPase subunit alpha
MDGESAPESAPLAVPAQITVLLALTANLFDPVPLEQMAEAGHAVREAASSIPAEISARFETAAKLSDEDKKAIIEIARQALAPFQPKPEPKLAVKSETKPAVKVEPKAASKTDVKGIADAKPKEEVKPEAGPEVKAETKSGIVSKPEPSAGVKPATTDPKEKP